jgi:hypothetical protein
MRRIVTTLAFAALGWALPGCNGDVTGGVPAEFTGPGSYTVPAVPSVAFPIDKVHLEQEAGAISIYYQLPAELVGQATWVKLASPDGSADTLALSGEKGTSTCTVTVGLLSCDEHLTGVAVGPVPPSVTDAQRAAAAAFASDPIGVLTVPLPP